jgi:hypothetical protein
MEWHAGKAWQKIESRSISTAQPSTPPQPITADAIDHTSQWIETILARPLFTPDRRPPAQPHIAAAPRAPVILPRLAGVLVSPAGKAAIFAANGAKPTVVCEGGQLGQYTVQSIEAGHVTLRGPDGAVVMQPTFEATAKPAPAPAQPDQANAAGWGGVTVRNDSSQ